LPNKKAASLTRRLLQASVGPAQAVEIGGETIKIGGATGVPEWLPTAETYTLTDAQVLGPAVGGTSVIVRRGRDALPLEEKASEITVELASPNALRARTRLAMATAVPVQIDVKIAARLQDARRRYRQVDIRLPADIHQAVRTLIKQADLFPDSP
jgi:hypothetical protein